jgi:phenylpropionate dioxygenase-like ring-hydroxylating dioxygenase large terminal subunit
MVGDVHVLLTLDGSDLHAFANTCRHRAHELLEAAETSTRQSIVCPYHAWSYDLGGRLRKAPGYQEVTDFRVDDHRLVELPVHRWHGWVFVHAATSADSGQVLPFAEFIGDLEGWVAPYDPAALVLGDRHTYVVEANWKVIAENYHECYHCPLIHPELCQVSPPTSGDNLDLPGAWVGGTMDLRDGMHTMSLTGESAGRPIPGAPSTTVLYAGLVPNLLISAHPDYVMTHRLVPLSPGRTWVECSWLMPDTGDEPAIDASYAVEFWDLTNKQDWHACESVQRGLASPHFRPGPFSPSEDAVHLFATTIARAYRGLPIHLPSVVPRDHPGR